MKRNILKSLLFITATLLFAGCYADKSSLDVNKFDEIVIGTTSIPDIIRVEYLENLVLDPVIKVGNNVNIADVTYKWQINQTPGSSNLVLLSETKKLDAVITNKTLSAPYTLVFTAIDTKHGVEYQKAWPLYVSSSFREGIVVADTKNGTSSDLNLIMDNSLTTSYTKGQNIKYNIWKTISGNAHPALVKNITYGIHKPSAVLTKNIITVIYQNKDIEMYNCEDYSVYKTAVQIFPSKTDTFEPQAFYTINNSFWVLVVNNVAYGLGSNAGVTSFMLPASGTNYVDNAIVIPDNTSGNGPFGFWYNNNTGKIYNVSTAYTTPMGGGEYTTQGTFNPNNIPDRRMVAGDISIDGLTPVMLMKNNSTSNYELYAISFGYTDANSNSIPSSPKLKVDLPVALTSIINSAVSVFFSMTEPVMFVATSSKIYAVNFGGGVVSYSEKYSAPAGEQFTKAKLFVQGRYRLNKADFNASSGPIFESPLELNKKAVVVTTQKSEYEGYVYVIPISNPATGDLNSATAKKYSGFAKILDITFQGQ